ncbi:MAG TPA: peptidase M50 [Chloroflexi bacterium]|nr:peptidase M50 [Chloroflexota bacterium]HBY47430.1 peptidase M50 [Chloroflexota bacterium]HCG30319.1 peptidase M50 [Chloroflexota bacterium]HRA30365.1 site-2 protease family protein [Thermomicrobiales bacterium]
MFGRTIPLGSARGIPIRVHPTFLIVMLWAVYQWGIRAEAGPAGVIFGLVTLLCVFGCVLLHELAHAIAALRYGVRVRDITLLPVGGVARVEYAPLTPRSETVIALAGPAVNLAIVILLLPIVMVIAATRHISDPLSLVLLIDEISPAGFVIYIWIANILLATFNMLPAFPMDGGRVLRAILASFRGQLQATRIAVAVGGAIAILLATAGLMIGDYFMPMISLFVVVAAYMEFRHVTTESSLRGLPVGQYALWDGGGIGPDEPLAHAISGGPRDLVVVDGGVVVGMLWRRDLLDNLAGGHRHLKVADLMDRKVHVVESMDSLYDVHLWLNESELPAVPVVEQGRYRGVFTADRFWHLYDHIQGRKFGRYRQRILTLRRRLGQV